MNEQIYIHYGSTKFDPTQSFPIKNEECWNKPIGGLWASRKNASFGWKDWCEVEEFRDCEISNSFDFVMKDESKIAVISTLTQLKALPQIENPRYRSISYLIDFEECVRRGVDAIELCRYGEEYRHDASYNFDFDFNLRGWDCDSIIVLNPEAIVPVAYN